MCESWETPVAQMKRQMTTNGITLQTTDAPKGERDIICNHRTKLVEFVQRLGRG